MARRISGVGCVTVSLRRSMARFVMDFSDEATSGCSSFDGIVFLTSLHISNTFIQYAVILIMSHRQRHRHPDTVKRMRAFISSRVGRRDLLFRGLQVSVGIAERSIA